MKKLFVVLGVGFGIFGNIGAGEAYWHSLRSPESQSALTTTLMDINFKLSIVEISITRMQGTIEAQDIFTLRGETAEVEVEDSLVGEEREGLYAKLIAILRMAEQETIRAHILLIKMLAVSHMMYPEYLPTINALHARVTTVSGSLQTLERILLVTPASDS